MLRKLMVTLLIGAVCVIGAATALAYNEAPMLRTMVAAGELPPVEERLPEDPPVLEPVAEIGQYGGTVHAFGINQRESDDFQGQEFDFYLLRLTEDGKIVGNLAKDYKISDDAKTLTLYLRRGLKWSDGYPFTVDDMIFLIEDMHWDEGINTDWMGKEWFAADMVESMEKIDDYTVRFEFREKYPLVLAKLIRWPGGGWVAYAPKHYLKEWHIKYNPKADELAKEEGFDSWGDSLYDHWWALQPKDVNKPTMGPFDLKKITPTTNMYERNPYYWKVDTAGNQLPYIDKVVVTTVSPEVYPIKIMTGEADVAFAFTQIKDYVLYKESEEQGDYRVYAIPGPHGGNSVFCPNQTIKDPYLRGLFQNVKFRQALSLGINRQEINDIVFHGLGVPRQMTIAPSASFYKESWAESYARYDSEEANRLLDELGLTEKDESGFRLRPNGKPILLLVEFTEQQPTPAMELVKEYWEKIGLKVRLKPEHFDLYGARADANEQIIPVNRTTASEVMFYAADADVARAEVSFGPLWDTWLDARDLVRMGAKTLEDFEGGKLPGEEPPEDVKQLWELRNQLKQSFLASTEYRELAQKYFDFHAEKLYLIGTVGMVPHLFIAKKNIGNIPKGFAPGVRSWGGDLNYWTHQLFFKKD